MRHEAIRELYPNIGTIDDDAGVFDLDGNPVEVDENEYYDPNAKDNIGGKDRKWDSNYNDTNNKRDTVVVNKSYNVGDLVDETDWETGKATKKSKK